MLLYTESRYASTDEVYKGGLAKRGDISYFLFLYFPHISSSPEASFLG